MLTNPPLKQIIAFIDGQSPYLYARESFGYTFSNDDLISFPPRKKGQRLRHNIRERNFVLKKICQG